MIHSVPIKQKRRAQTNAEHALKMGVKNLSILAEKAG
jgi:hypothetical protein